MTSFLHNHAWKSRDIRYSIVVANGLGGTANVFSAKQFEVRHFYKNCYVKVGELMF